MSTNPNANYLMQRAIQAGITDPTELANFMGQMQVESKNFTHLEENLHYSGSRLLTVFHGRNGIENLTAADRIAAGGPETVGNAIYGGEWGRHHGNTEPGDGYKYRGRGFVQLTGRPQYEEYSHLTGLDLTDHPELASNINNAATIAIAYWKEEVVKHNAQQNTDEATYYINRGYNGLADRRAAVAEWEQKLQHGYVAGPAQAVPHAHPDATRTAGRGAEHHPATLHEGSRGDAVRALQDELTQSGYPLHTDGDFGENTLRAVEAFQRDHGLTVDGKAGPLTRQALQSATHPEPAAVPAYGAASTPPLGFDDPARPQHRMYEYLKGILPAASDERFCQATAACHVAGINKPEDLSAVHITDTKALFCTNSLFANMAEIDLAKPIPTVRESLQQVQQFDQQQQMQAQQTMQQQPTQGSVMHH